MWVCVVFCFVLLLLFHFFSFVVLIPCLFVSLVVGVFGVCVCVFGVCVCLVYVLFVCLFLW